MTGADTAQSMMRWHCLDRNGKRFRGRSHHHLPNRTDDQVGLIKMNPVCAGRSNNLLHAITDLIQTLLAKRRRFSRSQQGNRNSQNRIGLLHFSNRLRHRLDVTAHPNVVARARPVRSYHGPHFRGHFAAGGAARKMAGEAIHSAAF